MAHVGIAVAVVSLLLGVLGSAGSASAQDPTLCLSDEPYLLVESCFDYLTDSSATAPDSTCCLEVTSITSDYGADCLCRIELQEESDPNPYFPLVPGRIASLATLCNSNADMSKCGTPASTPVVVVAPPPTPSSLLGSPPPPSTFLGSPPAVPARSPPPPPPRILSRPPPPRTSSTPALDDPSGSSASASKGSTSSKAAIVGGSVAGGGLSVMGLLYILVAYVRNCINSIFKPCCCCLGRRDKLHSTAPPGGPVLPAGSPHQAYPHVAPPVQHWRPHLGTDAWV